LLHARLAFGEAEQCRPDGDGGDDQRADQQEGAAKGVDGTPGTFINGQFVNGGAIPYTSFKQLIDQALQK
jgi:protein-disulfide isomerase